MDNVRKFQYRPTRKKADFAVEYKTDENIHRGVCRDLSDTGVRAKFDTSPVIGDLGRLSLYHPTGLVQVEAKVAYIDEAEVALAFQFESDWQRGQILDLVSAPKPSVRQPSSRLVM